MTRKCAICKETNYKNGSSFFSAPKDPKTRKLWQDAIGIENYVVKDETFVCSKHFYPTDIITHWFSGVPPNVITIKYKKFRLRPGAVPKIKVDPDEIDPQFLVCDEESRINRSFSPVLDTVPMSISKSYQIYSIPRTNVNESNIETIDFGDQDSQESYELITEDSPGQETEQIQNYNSDEDDIIIEKEQIQRVESDLIVPIQNDSLNIHVALREEMCLIDNQNLLLEKISTSFNTGNSNNEALLFEDLLEMYTEVNLPKGWNSFVISKGHGTTIVYCSMKMNKSGMPVVEKQVFVKNNMHLHCSVKEKRIDPIAHNLVKNKSNATVKTLADVEELIEEFNKRKVCEGKSLMSLESKDAFQEGPNWRHNSCSLIINKALSRCSRCASLGKRKSAFANNTYSVKKSKLAEREKQVKILNESLEEEIRSSKCEDRLPTLPLKTINLMSEIVDVMQLPEIQKVMIKECFKLENREESDIQFSRTWIFLCLLLYIESPEMYKYMLLNKYMNLPPLFTVRAYLRKVKTDRDFYNLFQQSIETFQPFCEDLSSVDHSK